ncbi:zinc finger MYM-type protein 1-like [Acyrthosiphon pisum]|uniref:TTF-type domain-containing protein n=1 Tax=Acyrthosiphon pisum TaxID=7029 RepID=A0A8R1X3F0_ACYPI|nr:zinc finger MYM-type protein 1-like [Acyrthosiphon pisum]|eukprot:XP_008179531.1 PREDICTED: zinc finger MYM-type protein 1-like [Acyrthosiphon pisum]
MISSTDKYPMKLVVTNSSSTTTLESQNEQLNIGIEIDITAQKSIESIVDENNVICDLGTLITGPVRPILTSYPLTKFGAQNRAFDDKHYKTYEWLEYSISKDSIFCFACRNFNTGISGNSEDSFLVGFRNWKKLGVSSGNKGGNKSKLNKLDTHAKSNLHLTCMVKWSAYQKTKETGSVYSQISSQHTLMVEKNRKYMKILVDIVLFISCQGIGFRGHDETKDSLNQDELTSIVADVVKETIVKDIEDVEVFGIMCDEARCYKQEQMALCVRYVKNLDVVERFLGFIDCSKKQDAESLYQHILWYLKKCKLNSKPQIVAQSYDGANVMSGKFNGLQSKVKNEYPYAIDTHCMAHKMNLIVIDMCKYVKETRNVFNTLESLYIHFSHPSKNQHLIEIQTNLGIKHRSMIRLSDTRWNCRYRNIECVKASYKAIIQALEEEIENEDDRGLNEAIEKTATLGQSNNIIQGVMMTFKNLRTTEYFSQLWSEIETFAKDHDISIQTPSKGCKRKRQEPTIFKDFDVTATTSAENYSIDETNETIEGYF